MNNQLKTEFEQKEFFMVRSFFPQEEIQALLESIKNSPIETGKAPSTKRIMTFLGNIFLNNQNLQSFIVQQKITDGLNQLTDSARWVRWDQVAMRRPVNPRPTQL